MMFSPFGEDFDFMFTIVPVIVVLVFIAVFGFIIVTAVKGIGEWNKNNNSPVLTVDAKIVSKRMEVHSHIHHHGGDISTPYHSSSTTYYAAFEVESGDRMELRIPAKEYGILAEGDIGKLTFQGTRYKAFERSKG